MDATQRDVSIAGIGLIAAPVAFAIDLEDRFALVHYVCVNHAGWITWLITIGALGAALLGMLCAWRTHLRFLSVTGLMIGAMFALAIIALAVPDLFLRACE